MYLIYQNINLGQFYVTGLVKYNNTKRIYLTMSWEFIIESEDGDGFSLEVDDELFEKIQMASKKEGIPIEQLLIKIIEDRMNE